MRILFLGKVFSDRFKNWEMVVVSNSGLKSFDKGLSAGLCLARSLNQDDFMQQLN